MNNTLELTSTNTSHHDKNDNKTCGSSYRMLLKHEEGKQIQATVDAPSFYAVDILHVFASNIIQSRPVIEILTVSDESLSLFRRFRSLLI